MSRIFDMLRRGKGDISDVVRPIVEKAAESPPAGTGAAPQQRQQTPNTEEIPTALRTVNLRIRLSSPLMPFADRHSRPSEQYRILRTKISHHPRQPRAIVVSSPAPGDGKSVTAINLAGALALKAEGRVLLVDADLRKPAIHDQLGAPESPGLAEALASACAVEEAIVRVQELPNLFVLPGGNPPENPTELLDSERWKTTCSRLRALFHYIVFDSPPMGALADYDLIQAVCDGTILVMRPDHTNRALCQKALSTISGDRLLGVLLNCVPDWAPGKAAGSDYYYYSAAQSGGNDRNPG